MNHIDIIDEHLIIRETVGYEVLNQVPIEDMPKVLEFLKIVYNYNRMKRVVKDNKEPGWVDPLEELFDFEEAAEKYKKKAMKEIREEREEEKRYEQYKKSLQILNKKKEEREEIRDWMEEYYDDYIRLQTSGMFWEFHPTWTGVWEKDKYAFCHDRKFKKK